MLYLYIHKELEEDSHTLYISMYIQHIIQTTVYCTCITFSVYDIWQKNDFSTSRCGFELAFF